MPPSRVHLQVRGGIAGPWDGFQAPAANKTLCQGTFALSALGERDGVPVVLYGGAQRAVGAGSHCPDPAPCYIPLPRLADVPLLLQPHPSLSWQVWPLQHKLLLVFKGREHDAPSPTAPPWATMSKGLCHMLLFSSPLPTCHTPLSIWTCLAPKGSPTPCHLQTAKPCPLAKYRVF